MPIDGEIWSRFVNTSSRARYDVFQQFFAQKARDSHGPLFQNKLFQSINDARIMSTKTTAAVAKGEARVARYTIQLLHNR